MLSLKQEQNDRSVATEVLTVRPVPVAPGRLPGLGHLPIMLRDPLAFMESLLRVADVVKIYLGQRPMYVVNSLDLVHTMLVAKVEIFQRGAIFEKAARVLGQGLTVAEGEFHKKHRKMISPSLAPPQVDRYTSAMIDVANARLRLWQAGQSMDVNEEMHDLGMEMFSRALFRTKFAAAAADQVKQATPAFMAGIVAQSLYPSEWLEKLPIPVNRRFDAARSQMASAVDEIISCYQSTETPEDDGLAILGMLMAAKDPETGGRGMTDDQLRDEVINIVVAGAEAPGTTLAWLFYELGRHPDVERLLVEELTRELGDQPLTVGKLKGLKYARAIIKETLRLHTPTWMLTQRAEEATELGGFEIPVRAEVAFSLTALHRHSTEYGNPGQFDPLRWLDGRATALSRSAYMPFAVGKHRCLGEHFSTQVMLVALATIARRWRLVPKPGARVREVSVALVQARGLTMTLEPRPANRAIN